MSDCYSSWHHGQSSRGRQLYRRYLGCLKRKEIPVSKRIAVSSGLTPKSNTKMQSSCSQIWLTFNPRVAFFKERGPKIATHSLYKLEIVFTIAAPRLNTKIVYTAADKLTFEAFY